MSISMAAAGKANDTSRLSLAASILGSLNETYRHHIVIGPWIVFSFVVTCTQGILLYRGAISLPPPPPFSSNNILVVFTFFYSSPSRNLLCSSCYK